MIAGDGYVVVGSQDGQVRLYSERQQTRANTAIPGLGAPITAVDVTYDGKWVLATTNNYLMVVKTTFKVHPRPPAPQPPLAPKPISHRAHYGAWVLAITS